MTQTFPAIGTPGRPWGAAGIAEWRAGQRGRRSYADDVRAAIERLRDRFDVERYGEIDDGDGGRHPLFAVRSRRWDDTRPCVLVTGGVHGLSLIHI